MTRTRSRRFRAAVVPAAAVGALAATVLLSGCSAFDGLTSNNDPSPTTSATPTATETPYPSQFTRDGTFQSHIEINGMDYVYTLYPTKSTPRTNEWYPKGNKYFSFTFQVYDLNREIRDSFSTKRRAYLSRIKVESDTVTTNGGRVQQPYELDAEAKKITFDPEPLAAKYGMLITSPKGAFELRNQKIKPTSMDTRGIDLHFTATVWVQDSPGSEKFVKKVIKQKVPISIFPSDQKTQVQKIPVDAN